MSSYREIYIGILSGGSGTQYMLSDSVRLQTTRVLCQLHSRIRADEYELRVTTLWTSKLVLMGDITSQIQVDNLS